jgi:hypothetical protein
MDMHAHEYDGSEVGGGGGGCPTFGAMDSLLLLAVLLFSLTYLCIGDVSVGAGRLLRWAGQHGPVRIPRLELESLTLFPLRIRGMSVTVVVPREGIRVSLSCSYFALYLGRDKEKGSGGDRDSDRGNARGINKLITMRVDDFVVSVHGLTFEGVCGVPQKKLSEAKLNIKWTEKMIQNGYSTCLAMSMVHFYCNNIDLTLHMSALTHAYAIRMTAPDLSCHCDWADRGTRVVDCRVMAGGGSVRVESSAGQVVIDFHASVLEVCVQLLSKKLHMRVSASLPGDNFADLGVQPFLTLFGVYQDAEDDAIEVRQLESQDIS